MPQPGRPLLHGVLVGYYDISTTIGYRAITHVYVMDFYILLHCINVFSILSVCTIVRLPLSY